MDGSWFDRKSPYKLNQFLYTSEQQVYSIGSVKFIKRREDAVSASIVVEGSAFRHKISITYTLFNGSEHVLIANELEKEPSSELQTCHFVFPFEVPGREYHYDSAACVLKPGLARDGGSQLPGAGMGTYCGFAFCRRLQCRFWCHAWRLSTHTCIISGPIQ